MYVLREAFLVIKPQDTCDDDDDALRACCEEDAVDLEFTYISRRAKMATPRAWKKDTRTVWLKPGRWNTASWSTELRRWNTSTHPPR